jgi:hypothetical protein
MQMDYEVEEFQRDSGVATYLVIAEDADTGVEVSVTGSDREETIQMAAVELRRRVAERKLLEDPAR